MQSKSKSKTSSLKNSFNLKSHTNPSSNSSTQLNLLPCQLNSKQLPAKQKAATRSKHKKQHVLKKMQKEIKEIKVQIMQLKSQSNTANLTQVSSRQQLSNESFQQAKQLGRKKSIFRPVEQSKINGFELHEQKKENKNTHNLSNCNIVLSELKQPTNNQSSATLYHENRVRYRNLGQSNYYIDYYLLN